MSEKLTTSHEQLVKTPEITAEAPKTVTYSEQERSKNIEQAQEIVAAEAAKVEHTPTPTAEAANNRPHFIDSATKMLRMKQNLTEVQKRLKPAQKSLSKTIHQPLVRAVSESAGKTVTRPSGLLGGGLAAFVGSLLYLLLTSHYGYAYNYGIFLLFFVAGFILGIAFEYALYGLRRIIASR